MYGPLVALYPSSRGTLLIAALLLLTLGFAGVWIIEAAQTEGNPWRILPYFLIAAGVVLAVGFVSLLVSSRR
ncbi:MAG TPA: hypothetical protein VIS07_06890 [Candidatus Binatia bacterium]